MKVKSIRVLRLTTSGFSINAYLKDQLLYMKSKGVSIDVACANDVYIKKAPKEILEGYHEIPFTRKITPIQDIICLVKTIILIRRLKPDIVHSQTIKASLISMIAAVLNGHRCRLHSEGGLSYFEMRGMKYYITKWMYQVVFFFASRIHVNSFLLADFMIKNSLAKKTKVRVLGKGGTAGINFDYFNAKQFSKADIDRERKKYHIEPTDIVFLFIGRVVKDKGINELVRAFQKVKARHAAVKLLFVGPLEYELSPLDADVTQIIQTDPCIVTVGYQSDVRSYYALSDCFVFPSYREGFPNVLLQAGSYKLPCLASRINGNCEIIEDKQRGVLFPTKCQKGIEHAMHNFLENRKTFEEYGHALYKHVNTHFDYQKVCEFLYNEYKDLIQSKYKKSTKYRVKINRDKK